MSKLTHLPHIKNVKSGINKWDPMMGSIFEVYFTLPTPLQAQFKEDEAILTEQVIEVSGLDELQKTTKRGYQKFLGVSVSFHGSSVDDTSAKFTIKLNLNLRNVTDAFVFKIFKAWENLNYNLADGTRTLKNEYSTDSIRVAEANRNGEIWRAYVFRHVLLEDVKGLDSLKYDDNDARVLELSFVADYWDEDIA